MLLPERRDYDVQQQSLAEAALGVNWRRDLLATLGDPVGENAWSMRLQVRPLMRFVWLGAFFMACGGLLATLRSPLSPARSEAAQAQQRRRRRATCPGGTA